MQGKRIRGIILTVALFITLCSCKMNNFDCHPTQFPMSKWEGDGIELYIFGQENNDQDLIIINSGETKLVYDVIWHGNGLWNLEMIDRRVTTQIPNSVEQNGEIGSRSVGSFYLTPINEERCFLSVYGKADFPEGMVPNDKVTLYRVATDLQPEDILEIETYPNYSYCPTYRYGSKWISTDKTITIDILSGKGFEDGIGEVLFSDMPHVKLYLKFIEYNSMGYLVELKETDDNLYVREAVEKWQCEYFEDYFVATVIQSELYSEGRIITFNLIE